MFNKEYTKENYIEQFSIRTKNLIEKLDRVEEIFKEHKVPEKFTKHIKQQRQRLKESKEKYSKFTKTLD